VNGLFFFLALLFSDKTDFFGFGNVYLLRKPTSTSRGLLSGFLILLWRPRLIRMVSFPPNKPVRSRNAWIPPVAFRFLCQIWRTSVSGDGTGKLGPFRQIPHGAMAALVFPPLQTIWPAP